jgi:hypothetical protein
MHRAEPKGLNASPQLRILATPQRRDAVNETEWQSSVDLDAMLDHIRGRITDRKLRLFACACVRQGWELLAGESGRAAVEAAEAFADGGLTRARLKRFRVAVTAHMDAIARQRRGVWVRDPVRHFESRLCDAARRVAGEGDLWDVVRQVRLTLHYAPLRDREAGLPALLRDVVGTPGAPFNVEPDWRTSTALALAGGIYEERAFDRLPILADALQDAGCENAQILDHCRDPAPHIRGCWVVDLVLDRQ